MPPAMKNDCASWGNPIPASRYLRNRDRLGQAAKERRDGLVVGLDVSLKTTSVCIVEADGSPVWEGDAESEPTALSNAIIQWQDHPRRHRSLPPSEWPYRARPIALCCRHARHPCQSNLPPSLCRAGDRAGGHRPDDGCPTSSRTRKLVRFSEPHLRSR